MNRLHEILTGFSDARILDVGCGVGNFLFILKEVMTDYDAVVGIDQSENALVMARKNFADDPRIRFERMEATSMTFPDAAFDIVVLSNTLHHLADPLPVFREMERVLKNDGILLVNEMVSDTLDEKQISHRELHHFAAALDRAAGVFHADTYTRNEIAGVLAQSSRLHLSDVWDVVFPEGPEPTPEEVEQTACTVDRLLGRVQDETVRASYHERGEAVKAYVRKHGFSGATQRMVVLRAIGAN
ncbi:MAG: class I SAM-dependent methyltransferase [Bacillota bacterium]|nr:class I SAM-dependent methyltransferase [Bacillota bacterium]